MQRLRLGVVLLVLRAVCVCPKSARYNFNVTYAPADVKTKEGVCNRQSVEIVVSPLVTENSIRKLEVTWEVDEVKQGDWIGLYVRDPSSRSVSPAFTVRPTTRRGWSSTPFEEERLKNDKMYEPVCLGFWVMYWRVRDVIAVSCLQTNPTWMYDNKDLIGRLKLTGLFWPGTHNSGAYLLREKPFSESVFQKYVYNQDETVLNQLIHGVRYIDLRVGYKSNKWWIHHDFIKTGLLQPVIDDIKTFINNTKEIVIVDFHSFHDDFKSKKSGHHEFLEYLESQFPDQMASPALSWSATLDDIWASNRRLIISYNNMTVVQRMEHNVWEAVSQKWPDVRNLVKLRNYFANFIKQSSPRYPWAFMAEFTATAWDIVTDRQGGLRNMADMTNRYVTQWFRTSWGHKCNIVAMDFVRSTGIVNAAVEMNIIRQNNHC